MLYYRVKMSRFKLKQVYIVTFNLFVIKSLNNLILEVGYFQTSKTGQFCQLAWQKEALRSGLGIYL